MPPLLIRSTLAYASTALGPKYFARQPGGLSASLYCFYPVIVIYDNRYPRLTYITATRATIPWAIFLISSTR